MKYIPLIVLFLAFGCKNKMAETINPEGSFNMGWGCDVQRWVQLKRNAPRDTTGFRIYWTKIADSIKRQVNVMGFEIGIIGSKPSTLYYGFADRSRGWIIDSIMTPIPDEDVSRQRSNLELKKAVEPYKGVLIYKNPLRYQVYGDSASAIESMIKNAVRGDEIIDSLTNVIHNLIYKLRDKSTL